MPYNLEIDSDFINKFQIEERNDRLWLQTLIQKGLTIDPFL